MAQPHVLYAFPEPLPLPHARGVQVAHTIASLLDHGWQVDLAYVPDEQAPDPMAAYDLTPRAPLRTIRLTRRPGGALRILPLHSNRFFGEQLITWLRQAARSPNSPQVVMTRHLKTADALLKARLGIPLVYEAHEVFARSAKPRHRNGHARMEANVLSHADRVVAISQALADALVEEHGIRRPYDILHSSASVPEHIPEKPWHECARHVVYAGSLHGWKGVEDLIAAARWLPGHRITVIGGTEDQIAGLRERLPETGAEIRLIPHRPHTEIQHLLAEACIAVLPNRATSISAWTSPLKLFEYMGAGCAVVASDLPSIREILTPDEASLVPDQNPRELAKAIRALTDAPDKAAAQGAHLHKRAAEFTWRARGKCLAKVLRETADNHNAVHDYHNEHQPKA